MALSHAFQRLAILLDMVKFQHTVFALPFAIMSAFLGAGGWPTAWQFGWILAAMVGARTCAMTFNRIADLDYDARNPRTQSWALPTGRIGLPSAWAFCIASGAFFFLSAAMLNWLCLALAPVALVVVLGYSYTKRFTRYSHLALGLSLGIAPVGAWLGVTAAFALPPLLLCAAVICWVAGFDIIYACQDVEFDHQEGLYSLPATIGIPSALKAARFLHLLMIAALLGVWAVARLGLLYLIGVAGVAALLVYEHRLVRPADLSRINLAFFTLNGIASLLFMALTIADILRSKS
jgi:4-hydroxybenzoate polyprenyltransferase